MKKFPWKGLCIGTVIMTGLVAARCAVTAGQVLYYGGTDYMSRILADGWFYVGLAAALIGIISGVMALLTRKQNVPEEQIEE